MEMQNLANYPRNEPLTILAVDDTRASRRLISTLVERLGHTCLTAENGLEGWRITKFREIDMIVTDLEMPVWDGFDLIRAIRELGQKRCRQIPIVVCSTRSDHPNLNYAMELGADAFVTKPVCLNELRIAIENAFLASA